MKAVTVVSQINRSLSQMELSQEFIPQSNLPALPCDSVALNKPVLTASLRFPFHSGHKYLRTVRGLSLKLHQGKSTGWILGKRFLQKVYEVLEWSV